MASLYCSAQPRQSILGFNRPSFRAEYPSLNLLNTLSTPLNLRFKNAARLQVRQRLHAVSATNTNSSEGDTVAEISDGIKTSAGSAQGPPFLTILAGFLVFFLIFCVAKSIVMWLISLIIHAPPSK